MEQKMLERINETIAISKKWYEVTGQVDTLTNNKILGMLEMLTIVTGKQYYFDENGVHER